MTVTGKKSVVLLLALAVLGVSAIAEARHVRFLGPHPIAAKYGGGYCYIEAAHLHLYPPDHQALYQQVNDQYVFTGDPTPFGYDGEHYTYYGHHPIPVASGEPVFCLINGPHYHPFPPPSGPEYEVKDGVAFWVAPPPEPYLRIVPVRVKPVNVEYQPYATLRPVVEVTPPPAWHGEVYVPPPPGAPLPPGVVVAAPEAPLPPQPEEVAPHAASPVVVSPPPPPGVVVRPPSPVVVAPPPPPGVVVRAPSPPHAASPVVVAPPPPPGVVVRAPVPVVAPPAPPGVVVRAPVPVVAPPAPHGVVVGVPAPGVVVGGPVPHHDNGVRAWGAPGRKRGHR